MLSGTKLSNKIYVLLCCLVLSLCSAFQLFGFSNDYFTYKNAFNYYHSLSQAVWIEPTFIISALFLNRLPLGFEVFVFVLSFISLFLKSTVIASNFKNYLPVAIFYFCSIYLLHEYTQIRVSAGLAFFYFGFFCLNEQKYRKILFWALSITFHYSITILIVLAIISEFKLTWTRWIFGVIISLLLALCLNIESLGFLFNYSRMQGYQTGYISTLSLLSPGKMILYIPYLLFLWQGTHLDSREFKLLHYIILFCISTTALPDVLSTRVAGMGYFLAIIMGFKYKVRAPSEWKNFIFYVSCVSVCSVFSLVLL